MKVILDFLNQYQGYFIIALVFFIIILFIMLSVTLRALNKLEKKYKKMMRGNEGKNIETLILNNLDKIDEVLGQNASVNDKLNNLDLRLKKCLQKSSIIRYRAFEDVGSDLSFSIALLDDNNDGIVLTGLYGRNESTTYAKPIDKGISRYDLSEEEQQVLDDAMEKGNSKTK